MKKSADRIQITFLEGTDTLVLKKRKNSRVFITTDDSIIIGSQTFMTIVNYLVSTEKISPKILVGILEEYNTE